MFPLRLRQPVPDAQLAGHFHAPMFLCEDGMRPRGGLPANIT